MVPGLKVDSYAVGHFDDKGLRIAFLNLEERFLGLIRGSKVAGVVFIQVTVFVES